MSKSLIRFAVVFLAIFFVAAFLAQACEVFEPPPPPEFQGSLFTWLEELWAWLNTQLTDCGLEVHVGAEAIAIGGTPRFEYP